MPAKLRVALLGILVDQQERDKLIEDHVDLVHYIVGRVTVTLPDSVDREDLISAGIIGLIKAVDRFDPARGVKFETYASTVIHGEVMESLRARDWAPRGLRRQGREIARTIGELEGQLGYAPSDEEIARALQMEVGDYHRVLGEISGTMLLSLEEMLEARPHLEAESLKPGQDSSYKNPAKAIEEAELQQIIARAIEQLPEREKHIVALYYQEELTLREIGEVLGVTESRICQIHAQAISRLHGYLTSRLG